MQDSWIKTEKIFFFKTTEDPKNVANYICRYNFDEENDERRSQLMKDESEEYCWIIVTNCTSEKGLLTVFVSLATSSYGM
jgi:hypothetical protein